MPKRRDPYTVWLGVPEGPRPPNHYDLLGIATFESEPPVIADAADERTARVRKFLGGENDRAAKAVLARLAAARECLLDPTSRAEYELRLKEAMARTTQQGARADAGVSDSAAGEGTNALEPADDNLLPPPASESPPPVAAAIPQPPATSPPVAVGVFSGGSAPAGVPVVETGPAGTSSTAAKLKRQRMRRRRRSRQLMAAFVVTSLLLVGVAVWVVDQAGVFRSPVEAPSNDAATPRLAAVDDANPLGAAGDQPPIAPNDAPHNDDPPRPSTPSMRPVVPNEPRPALGEAPEPSPGGVATPAAPSESMQPPAPTSSMTNPAPAAPDNPPPSAPSAPSSAPPRSTPSMAPATTSVPTPVVVEADERELRDVRRSLAASWAAMADRDVARAEEQLDLALLEAVADETIAAVEHRRRLFEAYRSFWDAVAEAQSSLEPGAELTTPAETYVVGEVTSDGITARVRGRSREFTRKSLPVDLAVALAERTLGADSNEAKLAIGAFHATRGDAAGIDAARRLWGEASGAEAGDLLSELDEITR